MGTDKHELPRIKSQIVTDRRGVESNEQRAARKISLLSTCYLLLFLILLPAITQAFPNEPNGFGGINWWKNLSELKDMAIFQEDENYKYGYRRDEEYKLGILEIEKIVYCFYKDQFFAVYMETKGFGNAMALKLYLVETYGSHTGSKRGFGLYWQGEITEIAYRFDPVRELCQVAIMSREILERITSISHTWPVDEQGYFIGW